MSYRNRLDRHSELFAPTWARPKHAKAQVNGQTQQTQSLIILANEMKKRQF
ncbi:MULTISPECIES: YpzG family protein [unclassified Bacillus (in: firmicutes)]|uniref:YpzG family protein n=1 Tax=unclassified Bacillus (in: firmicutes) TaxID=185979 RepID=UPI00232CC236|nr:YpzG family protein [Bacillus sp. BP-3]MDC2865450.1 YpzG family protein [Bacillus sp. BP-3]